jgi:hypothetical protein
MFDNLSGRLGEVFDKLKGPQAFPAKVGTGFAVRKRANGKAASIEGHL